MKKIFIIITISILSLILIIAAGSCSKEKSENRITGVPSEKIRITGADANTITKTTLNGLVTSWIQTTDKVGIYAPSARTLSSGGVAIANVEFTAASSGGSSAFNGTMYWGAANYSHIFYAYYPYAAGSFWSTDVPVSLAAAQTQSSANSTAHIGTHDFLVATPLTVTSPDNTNAIANEVNLKYNHLFTVLEFQIAGAGQLKAVKLQANSTLAFSGGTINITQATPAADAAYTFASQTGTSKEAVVTLTSPATLTATNTDTKVYMVINPGTPTGNCLVGVSVDGTTWTYINKLAPAGGFKRGIKYVVTVNAGEATLENVVVGLAGKIWMDRNLGATQVATSGSDILSFGDLYQWGRRTDGHQLRTSTVISVLATSDTPEHGDFITNSSAPYDWLGTQNLNLWQGASGANNPCPSGFRLPTQTELNDERLLWSSSNTAGAFASPLKLPAAGSRSYSAGALSTGYGNYWTSTIEVTSAYRLSFGTTGFANMGSRYNASGFSVRCIKD